MLASQETLPVTTRVPNRPSRLASFLHANVTRTPSSSSLSITIATRESRLALWQAEHVKALLEGLGHRVELLGMTTKGDQILDRSLSKVGGKGLFVKELEVALEEGRADIAVHSLKDVPMDLPAGFDLACVMEREDPRDAWVSPACASLVELPRDAVVGTSSLRRLVLLRESLDQLGRQDVRIEPLRGNLDTRLRKLDEGQYHAIILAAAGLKRLGLAERIRHTFSPVESLPAAGQGALGIEVRADRDDLKQVLASLVHWPTWYRVAAERTVSRAMGGSCSMPLAAYSDWTQGEAGELQLDAAWGDPDARQPVVRVVEAAVVGNLAQAEALGQRVADRLRAAGATPPPASV
jgi:hydroxymethylbilane synthase